MRGFFANGDCTNFARKGHHQIFEFGKTSEHKTSCKQGISVIIRYIKEFEEVTILHIYKAHLVYTGAPKRLPFQIQISGLIQTSYYIQFQMFNAVL